MCTGHYVYGVKCKYSRPNKPYNEGKQLRGCDSLCKYGHSPIITLQLYSRNDLGLSVNNATLVKQESVSCYVGFLIDPAAQGFSLWHLK